MDKTTDAVTKKAEQAFFDKEGRIIFALKASREDFKAQLEEAVAIDILTPIKK